MTSREQAYRYMVSKLGVAETPGRPNRGPQIDAWIRAAGLEPPEPWCAALEFSAFLHAGLRLPIAHPAAVGSWVDWARAGRHAVTRPFKYDLVTYSWHGATPHPEDHIGTIEKVLALPWPRNGRRYLIRTIEGNTGDAVRRRWRWVRPDTVVFIRVPG